MSALLVVCDVRTAWIVLEDFVRILGSITA